MAAIQYHIYYTLQNKLNFFFFFAGVQRPECLFKLKTSIPYMDRKAIPHSLQNILLVQNSGSVLRD